MSVDELCHKPDAFSELLHEYISGLLSVMNAQAASEQFSNLHRDLKDEWQRHDGMSVVRNCQLSLTVYHRF